MPGSERNGGLPRVDTGEATGFALVIGPYFALMVTPGQSSVRKGDAGRPILL